MLLSAALAVLIGAQPLPAGLGGAFSSARQPGQVETPKFELKDGDRVVWLGGALVEREQRYGHWEAALLAAHPDKNITFRNLGWSGDTVHGEARGRFDFNNPDACFKQLVDQTLALKPTVILISYGANESFEGKAGLPKFEKGLTKLLDAVKPANARVLLFAPLPFVKAPGLPDPKRLNDNLALYRDALKATADSRKLAFAEIPFNLRDLGALTDNGVHLTEAGYKALAPLFVSSLGQPDTAAGSEQLEPLRSAVVAKNEQFFNKWRPQNETYLTGFRKHEQGRNAKEIAEFDPYIQKAEDEIAKLRKGLK